MKDTPELDLFRRLADALGETLESVCNLNAKERDELLLACGLNKELQKKEDPYNEDDIQEVESIASLAESSRPTGTKRKGGSLCRRQKRFLIEREKVDEVVNDDDDDDDDDVPLVSRRSTPHLDVVEDSTDEPAGPSRDSTTEFSPSEFVETVSSSPIILPSPEHEQEVQILEEVAERSDTTVPKIDEDDLKDSEPLEFHEKSTSPVPDEYSHADRADLVQLIEFVLGCQEKSNKHNQESLSVWYSSPAASLSSLADCKELDTRILDAISLEDRDQQISQLKAVHELFQRDLKTFGNSFYENRVSSKPVVEELELRLSRPEPFGADRDWIRLTFNDGLLSDGAEVDVGEPEPSVETENRSRSDQGFVESLLDVESNSSEDFNDRKDNDWDEVLKKMNRKQYPGKGTRGRKGRGGRK